MIAILEINIDSPKNKMIQENNKLIEKKVLEIKQEM